MAGTTNSLEERMLREQITRGFYGEGELVKTFLTPGQAPVGREIN
jgi:hypothetical protein